MAFPLQEAAELLPEHRIVVDNEETHLHARGGRIIKLADLGAEAVLHSRVIGGREGFDWRKAPRSDADGFASTGRTGPGPLRNSTVPSGGWVSLWPSPSCARTPPAALGFAQPPTGDRRWNVSIEPPPRGSPTDLPPGTAGRSRSAPSGGAPPPAYGSGPRLRSLAIRGRGRGEGRGVNSPGAADGGPRSCSGRLHTPR